MVLFVHQSLSVKNFAHLPICGLVILNILIREVSPSWCDPIFVDVVYGPPEAPFLANTDFVSELHDTLHEYGTQAILHDFNAD